jgi:hypothetical protein
VATVVVELWTAAQTCLPDGPRNKLNKLRRSVRSRTSRSTG